jgi:HD-like signal output (HDOD) protein
MATPVVERILASLRRNGDFPAMESTIGQVSQLSSSEPASASVLVDAMLQQHGVAQKFLRLVNTAAFVHGQQVTTISRAVLLLGFERARTVAAALILIEHLQAQAKSQELMDALTRSFYSATLGRAIADRTGFIDPEEAFIAALLHNLGRIVVALHLPDERDAIEKASAVGDSNAPADHDPGLSYARVGIAIANVVNLPGRLGRSMTCVPGTHVNDSMSDEEKLGALATLTNRITDTLASDAPGGDKRAEIVRLIRSYASHLSALDGSIDGLLAKATIDLEALSKAFGLAAPNRALVTGLGERRIASLGSSEKKRADTGSAAGSLIEGADADLHADELPEATLTRGLHEITGLLIGEYTLDDVLRVILETMYRALGVGRTRTLFLLKDLTAPVVRYRFGLGLSPTETTAWQEVSLGRGDEIFSLALGRQKDLVIKDSTAPEVAPFLRDWHRRLLVSSRFVVLLPLVVDQRALGLFYVDGDQAGASLLTSPVLNYLKVLRGQAVIAIHQKSLQFGSRL